MANYHIHVGSITNAMRGKRLLEQQGIRAFVHRSSDPAAGDGCGYTLLVTEREGQAERILRGSGVRVIRISEAL